MTAEHSPSHDDRPARTTPPVGWWHNWQRIATQATRTTIESQTAVARGSIELWRGTLLGALDAYEQSMPGQHATMDESRAEFRRSVEEAMDALTAAYVASPRAFAEDVVRSVEQFESLTAAQQETLQALTRNMYRVRDDEETTTEPIQIEV